MLYVVGVELVCLHILLVFQQYTRLAVIWKLFLRKRAISMKTAVEEVCQLPHYAMTERCKKAHLHLYVNSYTILIFRICLVGNN